MIRLTDDIVRHARSIVRASMRPTPQIAWPLLAERTGAEVWVKHENHTPIGAFKIRGGLVYMDWLKHAHPEVGHVISATRGNHGQSIARAATANGFASTIYVPRGNSVEKNAAMRAFGARLVEHGEDFDEAREEAERQGDALGAWKIPSFDEQLVFGVSTYGLELFEAAPDLHTVYVPIGMGSGMCGLIAARDHLGLSTRIVGVVMEQLPAYALSFEAGKVVTSPPAPTIADGMATRIPHPDALAMIRAGGERIVRVNERSVRAAMRHYLTDTHNLAEGAGAAPLAALLDEREQMRGRKVGVILSGGNVDMSWLSSLLANETA
ncbi:MAG: threonine dehydratase [Geminicoccaceae bacterium]